MTHLAPLTTAACALLLLTVAGLWFPSAIWVAVLAVTVIAGYFAGILYGPAIVWLALLALLVWGYRRSKSLPPGTQKVALCVSLALLISIATVLLGMHALPGFRNPLLV